MKVIGINMRANETDAMFMSDADALEDRKQFVMNLGELLSQTREGIGSCELDDNEIVSIYFKCGAVRKVNVHLDSYAAIIKDVTKNI